MPFLRWPFPVGLVVTLESVRTVRGSSRAVRAFPSRVECDAPGTPHVRSAIVIMGGDRSTEVLRVMSRLPKKSTSDADECRNNAAHIHSVVRHSGARSSSSSSTDVVTFAPVCCCGRRTLGRCRYARSDGCYGGHFFSFGAHRQIDVPLVRVV
jgi:hypothetical protein